MQHVPPAAAAADDDSGLTPFHHDEPEVEAEVALLPNPGSPLAINVAAVWLLRLRHGIAEELSLSITVWWDTWLRPIGEICFA